MLTDADRSTNTKRKPFFLGGGRMDRRKDVKNLCLSAETLWDALEIQELPTNLV